ncbi:MAG: type II toxin-antitoxin system HicA family toxin [Candidatus Rokubacteria bacterium]|nr:type II toxin-antitoxin system HicA family toxin [Candidatus Rokubacteria bacterium]
MKREALLRELRQGGCIFKRHGANHDIWTDPATGRSAPVPRHTEIADGIVRRIRKQLAIRPPAP